MKILKDITKFIFVENDIKEIKPNVDFYVCPIDTQGISKDNCFKNDYGIKCVLGEVEKCGKYFSGYLKELLIE